MWHSKPHRCLEFLLCNFKSWEITWLLNLNWNTISCHCFKKKKLLWVFCVFLASLPFYYVTCAWNKNWKPNCNFSANMKLLSNFVLSLNKWWIFQSWYKSRNFREWAYSDYRKNICILYKNIIIQNCPSVLIL